MTVWSKSFGPLVVLLSFLLPPAARAQNESGAPTGIGSLAWMAGSWIDRGENRTVEEYWQAPSGKLMLGLHRDVKASGRTFFEFLRIEEREDGIFYLASPMGREATPFKLTDSDGKTMAVFENPDHDFPKKIVYRLDGQDKLCAEVSGTINGAERSERWCWQAQR